MYLILIFLILSQPKLAQEYWWDVARVTSRDFEIEQMINRSRIETFKILFKLLGYLIFFIFVLISSIVSKLSLFTMINAYKIEKQYDMYRLRWGLLISTSICVPYMLSFLSSLQTVLFASSRGNPGFLVLIWVLCVEMLQTLGIVIFIFKVLPQTGNVTGLFLMGSVCFVPALLKVIFSSHRGMTRFKKFITFLADLLAIVCQASVWLIFVFVKNFDSKKQLKTNHFELYLVVSTLLISLGWWENFAQVRFTTNRVSYFIQNKINELRKYNAKIYLLANACKIVCTFLFTYVMMSKNMQDQYPNFRNEINFTTNKMEQDIFFNNATVYFPFLLHIVSTAICYYTGRTACKVLMQGLGFSLPLLLSTPATLLLIIILSMRSGTISVYSGPLEEILYLDRFDSMFSKFIFFT
jgi:hypothetical protein